MLEILVGVGRMPIEYRTIRKATLLYDYTKHLEKCEYALDTLYCLIGDKRYEDLSTKGKNCYNAIIRLAGRN